MAGFVFLSDLLLQYIYTRCLNNQSYNILKLHVLCSCNVSTSSMTELKIECVGSWVNSYGYGLQLLKPKLTESLRCLSEQMTCDLLSAISHKKIIMRIHFVGVYPRGAVREQ